MPSLAGTSHWRQKERGSTKSREITSPPRFLERPTAYPASPVEDKIKNDFSRFEYAVASPLDFSLAGLIPPGKGVGRHGGHEAIQEVLLVTRSEHLR